MWNVGRNFSSYLVLSYDNRLLWTLAVLLDICLVGFILTTPKIHQVTEAWASRFSVFFCTLVFSVNSSAHIPSSQILAIMEVNYSCRERGLGRRRRSRGGTFSRQVDLLTFVVLSTP